MFDNINKPQNRNPNSSNYSLLNNRFSMKFPPGWEDRSYYRFEGPVEDGIKHSIIVTIEKNVDVPNLEQYADLNIKAVEKELQGYQQLKRGPVTLEPHLHHSPAVLATGPGGKPNQKLAELSRTECFQLATDTAKALLASVGAPVL